MPAFTNSYEIWNVLPNYFAMLFYATYAAWADREYMSTTDDWSRVVESSHAIFCGLFSLLAVYNYARGNSREFLITLGISMGSQIMNSLLYMVEYFIQCDDSNNINYNSESFPTGILLSKYSDFDNSYEYLDQIQRLLKCIMKNFIKKYFTTVA